MSFRLVLDPIACDGHGICAELFPEGISLDDWGYPILPPGDVPPAWRAHARRAATACPKLALTVVRSRRAPTSTTRTSLRAPWNRPAGG
jgi:ferredoxin